LPPSANVTETSDLWKIAVQGGRSGRAYAGARVGGRERCPSVAVRASRNGDIDNRHEGAENPVIGPGDRALTRIVPVQ
jgi:hypothetical protein